MTDLLAARIAMMPLHFLPTPKKSAQECAPAVRHMLLQIGWESADLDLYRVEKAIEHAVSIRRDRAQQDAIKRNATRRLKKEMGNAADCFDRMAQAVGQRA